MPSMTESIPCGCGCGTVISQHGRTKLCRFKRGHKPKAQILRDDAYWALRLRRLHLKAKLCLCDCGERVLVSDSWLRSNGAAGRCVWLPKYKDGHTPLQSCACGCGTIISSVNSRGIPVLFAPKHHPSTRGVSTGPRFDWDARVKAWNATAPICACGCGQQIKIHEGASLQHMYRERQYISGHNRRRACVTEMTQVEKSVILGSLLGDFSIGRPHATATARLAFTHGEVQQAYAEHKMDMLSRFGWLWSVIPSTGYKLDGKLVVGASSCMPLLDEIFALVRPEGLEKKVTLAWLNQIDDIALAYWFMDDGSSSWSHGHVSNAILHTEGYSLNENALIVEWLSSRFPNVRVAVYDGYPCIYFPREAASALLDVVLPNLHPSLSYKGFGKTT